MCAEESETTSGLSQPVREAKAKKGSAANDPSLEAVDPASKAPTASASSSGSSSSSASSSPFHRFSSPQPSLASQPALPFNINVGVMGHVDSGKTSLVRALSTHLSTASLDKHPQSQERGITLDLGFSSFLLPYSAPSPSRASSSTAQTLQVTLVDCPGHGSLIRTIIGGAQIIDLVLLLVDATKGVQAQTVECVMLAEVTAPTLVVALNKIDLFPAEEREEKVRAATAALRRALRSSRFQDAPIVPVAAVMGGGTAVGSSSRGMGSGRGEGEKQKGGAAGKRKENSGTRPPGEEHPGIMSLGLEDLSRALQKTISLPRRSPSGPLFMAVDHCFPLKGQGTVLTGTVLRGRVSVQDVVELPALGLTRRVKSLQAFHRRVTEAQHGDRVGLCLTHLDAKEMERGALCTPGSVPWVTWAVGAVRQIRAFRGRVKSGDRIHVSVGHGTVMATLTFFGAKEVVRGREKDRKGRQPREGRDGEGVSGDGLEALPWAPPDFPFCWEEDYLYQAEMAGAVEDEEEGEKEAGFEVSKEGKRRRRMEYQEQYALFKFETPVLCPLPCLVIGSRLDVDIGHRQHPEPPDRQQKPTHAQGAREGRLSPAWKGGCRLAFCGTLLEALSEEDLPRVRIYKPKKREGSIYRLGEALPALPKDPPSLARHREVTAQGFFKKETSLRPFLGMEVETAKGQVGRLESGFGRGGKVRVRFDEKGGLAGGHVGDKLFLRFRRYVFDQEKRMVQRRQAGRDMSGLSLLLGEDTEPEVEVEGDRAEGGEENSVEGGPAEAGRREEVLDGDGVSEPREEEKRVLEGVDLSALEDSASHMYLGSQHPAARGGALRDGPRAEAVATEAVAAVPVQLGAEGDAEWRMGHIEKVRADGLVIVTGLFTMEEDVRNYKDLRVGLRTEEGQEAVEGYVVGPFGKGGKAKVQFPRECHGLEGAWVTLSFSLMPQGEETGKHEGE